MCKYFMECENRPMEMNGGWLRRVKPEKATRIRLGILVCDDVQLQPFLAAKRGSSTSHVETSEKGLAGTTWRWMNA
jgi:hypothetical protein